MKRSVRRDYYAVLGITATAAPRDIRRAYQRLARQYSPDVNFWDAEARSLFDEIAEAYRVLSDPTARAMYEDRKSTRLNSSHGYISYAVFCLKKKNTISLTT